ncbi:MAG: DUF2075 domain-containing protein [Candidatus Scalindua sp. AMX11]|nr:MAG: DUF2075 domain-containing protein [Candidatus Scalindua sp.]NOG85391.1 DUF2075 domain-containing protein [Planctomycetota bacterium]RZV83988.1 MAG: DUF2075 domain-containing protein [Candidatus Scalindua sp. SCAELEC01]TDE65726.1 MAG: DUF2075 domain-containing protein [Candidatus Scalindua sp. AMX11]GJQ59671.1 MAG: hypothetical protein SCALA701_24720 [Candidatus Scalindua sp.]
MKERFLVLGRAGSGKTHLVIQKFIHYIKEHKEENVIFLLPTHSQVEHLRDHILRTSGVAGYFDSSLVTFSGLAERIVDNLPIQEPIKGEKKGVVPKLRRPIDDCEKDLVLSCLFKEIEKGYFSEVLEFPGFKNSFLGFVREIKELSLDPPSFQSALRTIMTGKKDSLFDVKLNELVTLYDRYQGFLEKKGLMDTEDYLREAIEHLNEEAFSPVELLVIDGFHDYTHLEFKCIEKLSSLIPDVYITLPYHPSRSHTPLFRTACKTYARLVKLGLHEMQLKENRRTSCQMLLNIEANCFSNTPCSSTTIPSQEVTTFQIIEAANMQDEVEQIARRIRKLIYKNGYRFSHIAVILRNVEKYQDMVEETFTRFSIPVRIYGKRPLLKNPLIQAVVKTTKVYLENWQDKSVWDVLNSYSGIKRDLLYRLELAHLSKGTINDCDRWLELTSSFQLMPVNKFLRQLKNIFKNMEGRHPFSVHYQCYVAILNLFYKAAFTLSDTCRDEGADEMRARNHNQEIVDRMKWDASALGEFLKILNSTIFRELYNEMGDLTFEGFNRIVMSQLALTLHGKRDRRKDVVNVINVLEARQWEVPVVFVGGLLEKEFPRQVREDLFLKDFYRKRLKSAGQVVLREAIAQMDDERYLFYIALTRANERLYLSYPSANRDGNVTLPSFFLSEIKKMFTKEMVQKILVKRGLSQVIPEPEEIVSPADLKGFVYYHFTVPYTTTHEQSEEDVALWLYNNSENGSRFREELSRLNRLMDSYGNVNVKLFDRRAIKKIRETTTRFSPSNLKDYAQCPYKFFGGATLNLRQAAARALDSLLQGKIIHGVLEEYIKGKKEQEVQELFERCFEQETRGIVIGFEELKIKNEMLKTLLAFESTEKEVEFSLFTPLLFEEKFGGETNAPIKIVDKKLGRLEVSGKIDRVDVATVNGEKIGIIIDYKYGKTEFGIQDIEEGTDLQLPVYALALREVFKIEPVAAQFYALKTSKKTGIYNRELIERYRLKIGQSKKSLSGDTKEIDKRLEETKELIVKFTEEVRKGRIALDPHNLDRCGEGNCDFSSVCRIDKWRVMRKQ